MKLSHLLTEMIGALCMFGIPLMIYLYAAAIGQ